jgi:DNA polymerase-3 subunit epsilon
MVDNSQRDLHGALLDAEILADVYLVMTGGQVNLNINEQSGSDEGAASSSSSIRRLDADRSPLKVIKASDAELASHNKKLETIKSASGHCVWQDASQ